MTAARLQALLEFDQGVFHTFQSQRYTHLPHQHKEMSEAQEWLVANGLIHTIGDEYWLTEYGKDVRDVAVQATSKYIEDGK